MNIFSDTFFNIYVYIVQLFIGADRFICVYGACQGHFHARYRIYKRFRVLHKEEDSFAL